MAKGGNIGYEPGIVEDVLADFGAGVNSDPPPLKLNRDQLSFATNVTVRGLYARPRPPYNRIQLNAALEIATTGLFQAAQYYKPDAATEFLLMAVSGDLYKVALDGTVTRVNSDSTRQNAIVPQHWMWQAEKWIIWNDGINLPIFFDGGSCRRSNGLTPNEFVGSLTAQVNFPLGGAGTPIGNTFVFPLDANYSGSIGDTVKLGLPGGDLYFNVTAIGTNEITVQNIAFFVRAFAPSGSPVYRVTGTLQLPNLISNNWLVPALGTDSAALTLSGNYPGSNGDIVNVVTQGIFVVKSGAGTASVVLTAQSPVYPGTYATTGSGGFTMQYLGASSSTFVPELPPGKMGAYGMCRNVMALTNGKDFIISDIVRSSSGTRVEDYRDSVLHVTENSYLAGGGLFTVPGGVGDIRAIIFAATLDASLGQGPCQIFTPTHVFSVNVPVDRLTWQNLINPILTESLIGNGGLSQNGTLNANNDILFRSLEGIRSLRLARQTFQDTHGNAPISAEVNAILERDDPAELQFCSAVTFDNRMIMTAGPHASDNGVYHDAFVVMNFDPVSSLRGTAPEVYDGKWQGLNTLQVVKGMFSGRERCFAFTLDDGEIGLSEILPSVTEVIYDNDTEDERIEWSGESSALFKDFALRKHDLLRLKNGEIYVDSLEGEVQFSIFYKPDQYPCWTLWHSWIECAQTAKGPSPIPDNADTLQVQFRPRMGLGEPSPTPCDSSTRRPMREAYTFQIKFIVKGKCRFLGARFRAVTIPQPEFALPNCCPA